jgi:hypothetical protein
MTKKYFIKLAEALREARPKDWDNSAEGVYWRSLRQAIVVVCAEDNPRFDRARFYAWTEKE